MLFTHCQRIQTLLEREIVTPHVAPGACAAVVVRSGDGWNVSMAAAGRLAPYDATASSCSTWFDLASLTKPVVAFCIARCIDRGLLEPTQRVRECLPWAAECYAGDRTLDQLMSHRAGLLAHLELFAPVVAGHAFDRSRALRQVAEAANPARRPLTGGGFEVVYSDLGYILLGEVLQQVVGKPLDEWVALELRGAGIRELCAARHLRSPSWQLAPTEAVAWRGGNLRGSVHDDNAFVLSGDGLSGHAGLFGSIVGMGRWVALMLDLAGGRSQMLSASCVELLLAVRPGGSHRAGFDGKHESQSSAGTVLGPRTFGHLGFTGTSFWCDPDQDVGVVLLTNRVCPTRDNLAIRRARPVVHDALTLIARGGAGRG